MGRGRADPPESLFERLWLRYVTRERIRLYSAVPLIAISLSFVARIAQGSYWPGGDFLAFYIGGTFVVRGAPELLSSMAAQAEFQAQHFQIYAPTFWVSPPYAAWLFAPFARLPYAGALAVFLTLQLIAFGVSLGALARELGRGVRPWVVGWGMLQFFPTLAWLIQGQSSGLWLLLLSWIFIHLRRGNDGAAGVLLGLFALKPQIALALALSLLAAGRWRALASAAAVALTFIGAGMFWMPSAMHAYVGSATELLDFVRSSEVPTEGLFGSFEVFTLLLDGVSRRAAAVAGAMASMFLLGAVFVFWRRAEWRPASKTWDLHMAATLACGLIASPHLYTYDLMLLVLPLSILLQRLRGMHPKLPLDGGRVLLATGMVWVLVSLAPLLNQAQALASKRWFGFPMALQVGSLAVLFWAYGITRVAEAVRVEGKN